MAREEHNNTIINLSMMLLLCQEFSLHCRALKGKKSGERPIMKSLERHTALLMRPSLGIVVFAKFLSTKDLKLEHQIPSAAFHRIDEEKKMSQRRLEQ